MGHCSTCIDDTVKTLVLAMDNSYDGMVVADKSGRILYVNKTYEKLSGFERSELVGVTVKDLVKDGLYKRRTYKSALDYGKTVHHNQIFNKTNTDIQVTCKPVFDQKKEIEIVISNVRSNEITAQNKAWSAIREKYLHTYEAAQDNSGQTASFGHELICNSTAMREVCHNILKVSSVDVDILLEGETGTGKSTLARMIYEQSPRARTGRFVEVNCGAIPYNLIESELFGYEKGSFTGANSSGKKGLFEEADNGIIFLDEVEELALDIQAKLLSVLQERRIRRIGSVESKTVDFQVIAASNNPLSKMVANQKFRQDLFYRLNVVPIKVPSLKDRTEDILPMAYSFLQNNNKLYKKTKAFSQDVLAVFLAYEWPGNVRELENLIKSLVIISKEDTIRKEDLPPGLRELTARGLPQHRDSLSISLNDLVADLESELILKAIDEKGSLRKAAEALNITHSSLYRRLLKYNLSIPKEIPEVGDIC